jgi:hypothetical protein
VEIFLHEAQNFPFIKEIEKREMKKIARDQLQ